MTTISNKNIWITGASSGIGEALAIACAKEGAFPILTARNVEKLQRIQAECLRYTSKCWIFPADLSQLDEIDILYNKVLNDCQQIHLLVNNAGRSQRSYAIDTPFSNDQEIMQLNFFSAIKLTKLVLKHMHKQKNGHIIAVGSITGKFGFPMRTAYAASKHAIQGFFEALQCELASEPIRVTIIHPGRIQTNISLNALTENGEAYNKMDDGQAGGMPADVCAQKIISAIKRNKKEVLVGGKETLMVRIHQFLPWLYYKIAPNIKN
ncbi:MAG: SDR family NAD(P)-dependent oxidoreductase [Mangrovibacterium sp.]